MTFEKIIPQLIKLTSDVGKVIMSFYKDDIPIKTKLNKTPLTIVDQTAHRLIVEGLSHLTPNIAILSEESDANTFKQRLEWQEYWLIDPLDGTQDFLEQTGEFCICIAYIKNHQSIFGLVYAPFTCTHYYGFNNKAYKQYNSIQTSLKVCLEKQPLRVVIGHHSVHHSKLQLHLKKFDEYRINHLGSALKFCKIAQGVFDYYPKFGPCYEWDTAAGVCILQNAGGRIVDENNDPLKYNAKDDLLSPVFFASGILSLD